jgi:membrane-associated phospholipid phosphatase
MVDVYPGIMGPRRYPSVSAALRAAALCAAGLVATGLLAYTVPVFKGHDSASLRGFEGLNHGRLAPLLDHVAHLADPAPFALVGIALIVLAVARGRARVGLAIAVVLPAAAVTTELLKRLLAHPRLAEWLGADQISAASWPSGHATAAMSLALCGVLAVSARWRPLAATVGGLFAIAVSYAILALGWHFPSDVIGGFLVAALWTSLAVAAVRAADARRPPKRRPARTRGWADVVSDAAPVIVVVAVAALAVALAIGRRHTVASYARDHPSFLLGAVAIAAVAALLAVVASRVGSARER